MAAIMAPWWRRLEDWVQQKLSKAVLTQGLSSTAIRIVRCVTWQPKVSRMFLEAVEAAIFLRLRLGNWCNITSVIF